MQNYHKIKSSELKTKGKLINNVRYLPEGIHIKDRKPDPINELFIKEKKRNKQELLTN